MARQTVHLTTPLGGGWSATLTDILRFDDSVEAWFSIGKGGGPFYSYVPITEEDQLAQVIMEPSFRLVPDGLSIQREGRTYLASIPDSGPDKPSERALLSDTGLTMTKLVEKLGGIVSQAVHQWA